MTRRIADLFATGIGFPVPVASAKNSVAMGKE
jgi:hypothetical protein